MVIFDSVESTQTGTFERADNDYNTQLITATSRVKGDYPSGAGFPRNIILGS